MDRTELIIAMALLLFAAFLLGFIAHWAVTRLSRVSKAEIDDLDSMAEALHVAEEARDAANAERTAAESHYSQRLAHAEAELRVAMEALRDSRREAQELKAYLSRRNMPQD